MGDALRGHPVRVSMAISGTLCALYILWQPQSLDLAAQVFRADLFGRAGWVIWNDSWYSGHTLPGYSVLYPPLAGLMGPETLGVVCALASAVVFAELASRAYGASSWFGCAWFGFGSTVALFGGRLTFGLGLVFGLAAMLGIQRNRITLATGAGLAAGLASPVAGLFTAIAAAAVTASRLASIPELSRALPERFRSENSKPSSEPSARAAALVAATATVGTLAPVLAFPTSGYEPVAVASWIWIPATCLAALVLLPRGERALRWLALFYLGVASLALLIQTPLGGNVLRLGSTFAGPVLALALVGRGRRGAALLAIIALPLAWWQWGDTARDVSAAQGDPSTQPAFYAPLLTELDHLVGSTPVRIEIPPSRSRWEAAYVAPHFPLANGWLRQLEAPDFLTFTSDRLTAADYRRWLGEHGVSFVAVSDAAPDYLAADEIELLRTGVPGYLSKVWSNADWQLYEVRSRGRFEPGAALARGGARVTSLRPDGFSVTVPGPGSYLLRLGYTPYFRISGGSACLAAVGEVSTRLTSTAPRPQEVDVGTAFDGNGLLQHRKVCSK